MARLLSTLVIALLPLFTGCGSLKVDVHPGNLWIGVQPTWAENKQIESASHSSTFTNGPGGSSLQTSDAAQLSYTLGRGDRRMKCGSNESTSVSTNRPKGGDKNTTLRQQINANCVANPETVPPKK